MSWDFSKFKCCSSLLEAIGHHAQQHLIVPIVLGTPY